jgi:nitroreductase
MEYERSAAELIRTRRSCRTFDSKTPDGAVLLRLKDYLKQTTENAGIKARFVLLSAAGTDGKLGTYGFISGAVTFIAGIVNRDEKDAARFGYLFEKIVLFATDLGLSTCWLGGTFKREDFKRQLTLSANEHLAIISPVGYPKDKPRALETAMRAMIGANSRKPWRELFFNKDGRTPLEEKSAGEYAVPLEMVRLAPSASNKQPWRVIWEGSRLNFCLCRTKGYGSMGFDMQKNDIGIAMCHFELTARDLGVPGGWAASPPATTPEGWEYIASWQ